VGRLLVLRDQDVALSVAGPHPQRTDLSTVAARLDAGSLPTPNGPHPTAPPAILFGRSYGSDEVEPLPQVRFTRDVHERLTALLVDVEVDKPGPGHGAVVIIRRLEELAAVTPALAPTKASRKRWRLAEKRQAALSTLRAWPRRRPHRRPPGRRGDALRLGRNQVHG
jgi:hypothetical protein